MGWSAQGNRVAMVGLRGSPSSLIVTGREGHSASEQNIKRPQAGMNPTYLGNRKGNQFDWSGNSGRWRRMRRK